METTKIETREQTNWRITSSAMPHTLIPNAITIFAKQSDFKK